MDHIKKLVYIIVGCLTIVSLVFTLCHKVGHCASSDTNIETVSTFPLYYDGLIGFSSNSLFNDTLKDHMLDYLRNNSNYNQYKYVITFYESNSNSYFFRAYAISTQDYVFRYNSDDVLLDGYKSISIYAHGYYTFRYNFNTSAWTYTNSLNDASSNGGFRFYTICYLYSALDSQPNNEFSYDTTSNFLYPLFIDSGVDTSLFYGTNSVNSSTLVAFTNSIEEDIPVSGHTKGGVLSNYIDSTDMLEDDSSLPSVDTNPPSDPSSNPAWYQKILNGMGKINQSIQGGVLTIGDYLGQIKEDIENAIAWITEEPDSDEILDNVEPYLAENDLISGFLSSKTAIQGVYSSIGNVTAKTSSQMSWDIPFNLPSMSQTFHAVIDFGWYENIRATFEPFLNMFLCIGFLFSFIRSIPGILHGNSGEGDT